MKPSAEEIIQRVLLVVDLVPRGAVVSYGDIAGLLSVPPLSIGPRQVGSVMSRHGSAVPWWRVVNARGALPEHLLDDARTHWLDEGIQLDTSGERCRIDRHRANLVTLAAAYDAGVRRT